MEVRLKGYNSRHYGNFYHLLNDFVTYFSLHSYIKLHSHSVIHYHFFEERIEADTAWTVQPLSSTVECNCKLSDSLRISDWSLIFPYILIGETSTSSSFLFGSFEILPDSRTQTTPWKINWHSLIISNKEKIYIHNFGNHLDNPMCIWFHFCTCQK